MPLIDSVENWNKLGSLAEVNNSEIGVDLTEVGTITHPAGKFNNGSKNVGSGVTGNYISGANVISNLNQWCHEEWVKPDFNVANGVADNGQQNGRFGMFQSGTNLVYSTFHNNATWGLYTLVRRNAVSNHVAMKSALISLNAGTLYHMLTVFNPNGIAGGLNTLRVYLDGVLVGSTNVSFGLFSSHTNTFYFNCIRGSASIAYPSNMVIDNAKIYNSTSQETIDGIIANRNSEGFPVSGYANASRLNQIDGLGMRGSL